MHTFIDNVARHGNLYMSDRDEVAYSATLRDRASRLLHCDSEQVAIVASANEIYGPTSDVASAKNQRAKFLLFHQTFPR